MLKEVLALVTRIWTYASQCDIVMLYCATPQISTLGLVTLTLCRLRKKPFVLRKAAGTDYLSLGFFSGSVADFVVHHTDLFLAQTKHLVKLCQDRGISQTHWYPTSRPVGTLIDFKTQCRRFVFVGQVRPSKGIIELIEAAEGLPNNSHIDVYGPFFDGLDESIFKDKSQIHYRGILEPDNVQDKLRAYDAFVLPTKAATEGYPGSILEALSVGMPVISTEIGGIPELVNTETGILIKSGASEYLKNAMLHLINHDNDYQKLQRGALVAREKFSADAWVDWFIKECRRLTL